MKKQKNVKFISLKIANCMRLKAYRNTSLKLVTTSWLYPQLISEKFIIG